MSKTFGQLLDEYLASELKAGQNISSLYMYMEDYQTPKAVINTAEDSYDWSSDTNACADDIHNTEGYCKYCGKVPENDN